MRVFYSYFGTQIYILAILARKNCANGMSWLFGGSILVFLILHIASWFCCDLALMRSIEVHETFELTVCIPNYIATSYPDVP